MLKPGDHVIPLLVAARLGIHRDPLEHRYFEASFTARRKAGMVIRDNSSARAMDLAHAEFVHPETVGSPGAHKVEQAEVLRGEDSITVRTLWPDLPPNGVNRPIWTESKHVDAWQDMTWRAPSNLYLDLGVNAPGKQRSDGIHTPSAHILTPETERSTHYFWCFARQFAPDDPSVTEGIKAVVNQAFGEEDRPILEEIGRAHV